MGKCTLTLIRGLPGSGKSTYAKSLNVLHLEDDHFCMQGGEYKWSKDTYLLNRRKLYHLATHIIQWQVDCVVASIFWQASDILEYKQLAKFQDFKFKVIKMTGNYGKDIHKVKKSHIKQMKEDWEDYPGEISP